MKSFKIFTKIFYILMIVVFVLVPVTAFAASDGQCINHVDENQDGICDFITCAEQIPSTMDNVLTSLKYLLVGMVGIFIVTGIIILVIYVLAHFTNLEKRSQSSSQEQ